jgi:hypothetical protein
MKKVQHLDKTAIAQNRWWQPEDEKKIVNLEVVTTWGWKKIVNLEVVTTRGWKKIVNLEVVTTRGWKKIVNLEVVTTRGWKKIINLEVVTTRIWKKIVKVVNFVVVEGLQGCHDSSPPDNGLIFDKLHVEWSCLIAVVLPCAPWTWQHYCPYCFFARTTLLIH